MDSVNSWVVVKNWVVANSNWLFSGIGVVTLGVVGKAIFSREGKTHKVSTQDSNLVNNTVHVHNGDIVNSATDDSGYKIEDTKFYQDRTRILFIDDDKQFNVVKILKKSGWIHTKLVKDITTLNQQELIDANILFVDIQGVGAEMSFADEGLGLSLAIKDQYPSKKVIIYSAQTKGERFHEAIQKADACLAKNADPYEFCLLYTSPSPRDRG